MTIVFFKCSQCGQVGDVVSGELAFVQSKPHAYFWNGPAWCTGYCTVSSTQEEWEAQKKRPYPADLLEQYK